MSKKFFCKRCGYTTDLKSCLKTHLSRKTKCEVLFDNIETDILLNDLEKKIEKVYKCIKCNKELSSRQNKWKHEKICNKDTDNKTNEIIELKKRIEHLESRLLENNNESNSIDKGKNIINSFGSENLEYVNDDAIYKIKDSKIILYEFIKLIYFNKEYPENHNFYISNLRSDKIHIYRSDKFIVEDKKLVLKEIINTNKNRLLDLLVLTLKIYPEEARNIISTVEAFDTYICKPYTNMVLKLIEELAYNNRHMIIK